MIAAHGNRGDQILVQLPGVTDVEAAKRVIKQTAQLTLKLVEDAAPSREALLQATAARCPTTWRWSPAQGEQPGQPIFYLVQREAVITGRDLKSARAGIDPQTNAPDVQFNLNPQGAEKFKRETGKNVGRRLAIVLDGSVSSAPTIQSPDLRPGQHHGPLHHPGGRRAGQGAARGRAARHPASTCRS